MIKAEPLPHINPHTHMYTFTIIKQMIFTERVEEGPTACVFDTTSDCYQHPLLFTISTGMMAVAIFSLFLAD